MSQSVMTLCSKFKCFRYRISVNGFRRKYSFLNLEIVENSIVATNFNFLPNKLNICCRNYSREETFSWNVAFHLGGRHFVDKIGDISWTKEVTSRGHFWRHFVDKNVHEMSSISVTFRGHFLDDISWTFFGWIYK